MSGYLPETTPELYKMLKKSTCNYANTFQSKRPMWHSAPLLMYVRFFLRTCASACVRMPLLAYVCLCLCTCASACVRAPVLRYVRLCWRRAPLLATCASACVRMHCNKANTGHIKQ